MIMEKKDISELSHQEKKRLKTQKKAIVKCGKKSNRLLESVSVNSILQQGNGKFQVMKRDDQNASFSSFILLIISLTTSFKFSSLS